MTAKTRFAAVSSKRRGRWWGYARDYVSGHENRGGTVIPARSLLFATAGVMRVTTEAGLVYKSHPATGLWWYRPTRFTAFAWMALCKMRPAVLAGRPAAGPAVTSVDRGVAATAGN